MAMNNKYFSGFSGKGSGTSKMFDNERDFRKEMVSIYEIAFNPLNPHVDSDEEIRQFAETIYEDGRLLQPLSVYEIDDPEHLYRLLGGEKRLRALLLNAEDESKPKAQLRVPVLIESAPDTEQEEIERLLQHNQYRKLDEPEKLKVYVEAWLKVYYEKKKKNLIPAGMQKRDWVAMKLQIGQKKCEQVIHEIEGYTYAKAEETRKIKNQEEIVRQKEFKKISDAIKEKVNCKAVKLSNKTLTFSYEPDDEDSLRELLEKLNIEDSLWQ